MKKNASVITNGCPENRIDCARIEQFLVRNGWVISKNVKQADLIVFNACGLTELAQEKSLRLIKKLRKRKKPNSEMVVCGCLPKIDKKSIQAIYDGDIFGSDDIHRLAERLDIRNATENTHANYLIPNTNGFASLQWYVLNKLSSYSVRTKYLQRTGYRRLWESVNIDQPNTYYIKVSSGCLNACSYCAVKLSRGTVNSKSIAEIQEEFFEGLRRGFSQFALIGTDLGSYGRDIQMDLVSLLKEMLSVDGKYQIKLRNVNPRYLIEMLPGFLDIVRSEKVSHVTTAVQHGNDRILRLMRREYEIEECKFAINALKNACPNLKLRTQLMVGFPGETDSDFEDTLNLVDKLKLDFIEVYKYSPRPSTEAAKMANQVPKKVANMREFILTKKVLDCSRANRSLARPVHEISPMTQPDFNL